MELRQLDIFRILAHELNFTRAAHRANCVQSNVSVQIRALEDELRVPLFERLGQQVRLTVHGKRLLPYAERILRLVEEAGVAAAGNEKPAGTLVVGSPESVLTYRLPRILQAFRSEFPDVDLVFRAVSSAELAPQLERAELDLGLVIDDGLDDPRFKVEKLCPEPLSLLVNSRHPLLASSAIFPDNLRDQPFLLTDPGCAYRSKLERALKKSNVRPKVVMEFTSVETIKQCAALGMGIACLPTIVAESEIAAGKLVALRWSGDNLGMRTLAVWHKDKWLSPGMQAFLSLLRAHLSDKSRVATPAKS
ncbi:MAG TPA: LysR family transcriptional regulator [Candidatus Bathyarchaeia archaeon]|jgi:DNA-binding transcriptional LysR family regulator|nr:LysR family transcriptional regulator [Candidatus Bathyarchaeia archaeon]